MEEPVWRVREIAKKVKRSLPKHKDIETLEADGLAGLLDAARSFDPSKGVPFMAFAHRRIVGAMQDGLRVMHWSTRSKKETVTRTMHSNCDALATSFDCYYDDSFDALVAPLSGRFLFAITRYYRDGYNLKEIGELLGLTETGAFLILKKARGQVSAWLHRRKRDAVVDERRRYGAVGDAAIEQKQHRVRAPALERVGR